MSCTNDKERLTAFFDGELDAAERADTERHISGCSECLRDLGEIKAAALAVKSLPRPRAPKSIAEGVSRGIAGAGRLRRLDVWRRRLFYGVAAAAALLVVLNLAYFSTPSAPKAAAERAASAPAPGLALVEQKESSFRKDGKEDLGKAQTNALAREEQAANRPSAGQDKGGGEGGARRSLEVDREKKAYDGLRQEAPAAARKADTAPSKPDVKQELEAATAAPKPTAPPAPGAPRPDPKAAPEPELAKKTAAVPPADAKLKEQLKELGDEALRGRGIVEQSEKARALPLATAYTIGGAKAVEARAQVEALSRKWASTRAAASKAPAAEAAPASKPSVAGGAATFGRAVEPMVVEVTPAQLEELRAELAKAGLTIDPGAPGDAQQGAGYKDGVGAVEARKRAVEADADRRVDPAGSSSVRKVTLYFLERPLEKK